MNQGAYFGQLILGPAGSGKSTYCKHMQDMAETLKRNIIIINLDPAAENNQYRCDIDIKQLITLEDVMQEMELGPNGSLLFCVQYLLQNQQWLQQQLNQVIKQDDYVLIDCPGQIQLYAQQDLFRELVKILQNYGFSLIMMYMIDINFIAEHSKFSSAVLQALSAQIALELPSITVITKCDLAPNQKDVEDSLNYFSQSEPQEEQPTTLPQAIEKILQSNAIVSLRSLNLTNDDNIRELLWEADNAIQYGENLQPDDKLYQQVEENQPMFPE